ncbi:hypothetical protein BDV96DRAFT_628370 [Lophiotrema nucula]|uniref:RING-type domain-containing protein n=1 Tax=Lophiotrema nucula TaxID=690887 RepID=A0A6A5ZND5_9PLEO|nr:hypothetical protein BDV96DRAFT_628370 [Lophiotrema nucula]
MPRQNYPTVTEWLRDGGLTQLRHATSAACTICSETFDRDDTDVVQVKCGGKHEFHRKCIMNMFRGHLWGRHKCPNCKEKLFRRPVLTPESEAARIRDEEARVDPPGPPGVANVDLYRALLQEVDDQFEAQLHNFTPSMDQVVATAAQNWRQQFGMDANLCDGHRGNVSVETGLDSWLLWIVLCRVEERFVEACLHTSTAGEVTYNWLGAWRRSLYSTLNNSRLANAIHDPRRVLDEEDEGNARIQNDAAPMIDLTHESETESETESLVVIMDNFAGSARGIPESPPGGYNADARHFNGHTPPGSPRRPATQDEGDQDEPSSPSPSSDREEDDTDDESEEDNDSDADPDYEPPSKRPRRSYSPHPPLRRTRSVAARERLDRNRRPDRVPSHSSDGDDEMSEPPSGGVRELPLRPVTNYYHISHVHGDFDNYNSNA